ncbi:MAG: UDP-glucose/GDP-mannose dehydrogenase family protein [Deltaproteobacteria bacterium]|nr:UDP-glucose/GDP-mannose dehydrogenase family protein [Deltaproteobacteria bacterium]
MHVTVMGAGYVGLVTAAGLAETGANVICTDIDEARIELLQGGGVPIFETGLEELIRRNATAGRLGFTADIPASIASADVVFIAVGTPPRADGAANLRAVDESAEMVATHAQREMVLVVKSSVPVGTNRRVRKIAQSAQVPIHVVSNPEFLRQGSAVEDFLRPDRVVIGCDADDPFARKVMERLYHPVTRRRHRIVWMNPQSAELTKYVANTMLAMRISFMNEVAGLCEHVGADIHDLRQGVGSDARIGSRYLYAGPGYGGSCLPKDVPALVAMARDHGVEMSLAETTQRINLRQKGVLLRKLKQRFDGDLRNRRIGIWGLAFKPLTDDIRESPALTLIDGLLAEGAQVVAHDPQAMEKFRARYGDQLELVERGYLAAQGADALVLVTEWRMYQNPDFGHLKEIMRHPILIDGRNIWSSYGLPELGFEYAGIGINET